MNTNEDVFLDRTLNLFNKSDELLAYRLEMTNVPLGLLQALLKEPDEQFFVGGYNISSEAYQQLRKYVHSKPDVDFEKYDMQMACYQSDDR